MSDLVVTVPQSLWIEWIYEGDAVGEPETGETWAFWIGGAMPPISPGERLYIVAWGVLRGYAPVTHLRRAHGRWAICRQGGAEAVTIDQPITGFRGWRRPWWKREDERPFPDWQRAGLPEKVVQKLDRREERLREALCAVQRPNVPLEERVRLLRPYYGADSPAALATRLNGGALPPVTPAAVASVLSDLGSGR